MHEGVWNGHVSVVTFDANGTVLLVLICWNIVRTCLAALKATRGRAHTRAS